MRCGSVGAAFGLVLGLGLGVSAAIVGAAPSPPPAPPSAPPAALPEHAHGEAGVEAACFEWRSPDDRAVALEDTIAALEADLGVRLMVRVEGDEVAGAVTTWDKGRCVCMCLYTASRAPGNGRDSPLAACPPAVRDRAQGALNATCERLAR